MTRRYLPIVAILLLAFFLRSFRLTEIPPGLTHDEANHGRDSINVLDGVLLFYFPLNYGSEPLYNYVVAGNMALVGENVFALRLVNVLFGTLTVAATFLWVRRAFDRSTALVAAALLAVSFWPLATSRQALRAGMLPFLMTLAVIFFWRILETARAPQPSISMVSGATTDETSGPSRSGLRHFPLMPVIAFCLSVAAALHTYLAARAIWLTFPLFLLYLALFHRRRFRSVWLPTVAGLILAGLMVVPMFAYVRAHPEAETRLEMLEGPVENLLAGNLNPLLANVREALLALIWPGFGDHFLAYNIPGRPVFDAVTAVFLGIGLVLSLRYWRRPAYAFLLIWFGVGVVPSLITGPEANTTRNLGALPAAFILPAVGFVTFARWPVRRWGRPARLVAATCLALWLFIAGLDAALDYFARWGESPDVRAAYQQTLVEALAYVEARLPEGPVVISTLYPGPAHDPSIARLMLPPEGGDLRWVDGRYALLFPAGSSSQLIVPSSTPLHPAFREMARPIESVDLRPDDLDPSFVVYTLQSQDREQSGQEGSDQDWSYLSVNFGNGLTLSGARWLNGIVRPGETAELLTLWTVQDPSRVGPVVPPAFETDVVLFTHILDHEGDILAQHDSLEAPSWDWQAGDSFIQIHAVQIPVAAQPGLHETVVGVYDRVSGQRLPVLDVNGGTVGDRAFVVSLRVDEQ